MNRTVTIRFDNWSEAEPEKVITFMNDGQFTTNSLTSNTVPQTPEMFNNSIDNYIKNQNATKLQDTLDYD